MTREEKIKFVQEAVYNVEEVVISDGHFDEYTDEMLDDEVKFYKHILDNYCRTSKKVKQNA
jgi:hypothetical protein